MATIEIDEAELAKLRRIHDTVAKINLIPEGKVGLQRLHKLTDPQAITPDLDDEEKKAKTSSEWQKKFEELETKIQSDKEKRENDENLARLNSKFESGRQKLRERRYTAEGIEAVEKFMEQHGIADHEIAADAIEKRNPPQEIMSPKAFGGFNFMEQPKDDDWFTKAILDSKGNDDNAVLRAAVEAVQDVRQNTRR